MNNIRSILENKKFVRASSEKPSNSYLEQAKEFASYVGLPLGVVFKLFDKFGKNKVLNIRSFLKDYPSDNRGLIGIAYWKLRTNAKLGTK